MVNIAESISVFHTPFQAHGEEVRARNKNLWTPYSSPQDFAQGSLIFQGTAGLLEDSEPGTNCLLCSFLLSGLLSFDDK